MIEFPLYKEIKDKYCVCYFGQSDEYLVQLRLLKPIIERHFKGLTLVIGCKDEKSYLVGENYTMYSELRSNRFQFGQIYELKFDTKNHPVEKFLQQAEIHDYFIDVPLIEDHTTKCVILTNGYYPTMPMEQNKVDQLSLLAKKQGYDVEINTSIKNAGLVIGVENPLLFEAASQGTATQLYPTGVGTRLYKNMFLNGIVLDR